MPFSYICPIQKTPLQATDGGLVRKDGFIYPYIRADGLPPIPNFLNLHKLGEQANQSLKLYNDKASLGYYENFLRWLFKTFREEEAEFRRALLSRCRLKPSDCVLITGCGLGDDLEAAWNAVGPEGHIAVIDLAPEMVVEAARRTYAEHPTLRERIHFSICDAKALPFAEGTFHAAYHFGGINLFDDIKGAISEMARVTRPEGAVVFGDEGVGPWLKDIEYGRMAIANNPLWNASAPIELLPFHATKVRLEWILGNCFYLISFTVSPEGPYMDPNVPHVGRRGGSMATRYFGQLEGVTPQSKKFVLQDAERQGISVYDWLENAIRKIQESPR